jgi:hypothetical protein
LVSAVIAVLQTLVMLALFTLVFVVDAAKTWTYALCVTMLLLEIADRSAARLALREVPRSYLVEDAYSSRPLRRADRQLVSFNLASLVIVGVLLATAVPMKSFRGDTAGGVVVIVVALAPGALSLWRVRSHNSWRAVARIPAPPRVPTGGPES